MREKIRELEELSLVFKNSEAEWASSILHPSEAWARPLSHDGRSVCTERVLKADCVAYV
jgi:hypothetical protein